MVCEDYGSSESGSGDQENDSGSSPKSSVIREKSPGQSSSSSATHADDESGSTCSAQGDECLAVERTSSSISQLFERVSTDNESTCARTELVYIHPPAPVKEQQASTAMVKKWTYSCMIVFCASTQEEVVNSSKYLMTLYVL